MMISIQMLQHSRVHSPGHLASLTRVHSDEEVRGQEMLQQPTPSRTWYTLQSAASFNFSTKNNRQDGSGTPQRKTSYHRLAFGARTGSQGPQTPQDEDDDDGPELGLDQLEISDVGPELNKVNSTFEKRGSSRTNLTYDNCDEPSNLLNGTFDKVT